MFPNLVGVPKMIACGSASESNVAIGNVRKRRACRFGAGFLQHRVWHKLCNLEKRCLGARHFLNSREHRFGHAIDVAIHTVKNDVYLDTHRLLQR